jgi:hypothetical protein
VIVDPNVIGHWEEDGFTFTIDEPVALGPQIMEPGMQIKLHPDMIMPEGVTKQDVICAMVNQVGYEDEGGGFHSVWMNPDRYRPQRRWFRRRKGS